MVKVPLIHFIEMKKMQAFTSTQVAASIFEFLGVIRETEPLTLLVLVLRVIQLACMPEVN